MAALLSHPQLDEIAKRRDSLVEALTTDDGATHDEIAQAVRDLGVLYDQVIELRYRVTGATMMLDGRAHAMANT